MLEQRGLRKTLFREAAIYSIGNFGSRILSFLLVPFYTYYLTKQDLGEYDLVITAISFIVPLTTLQLSDAVYRWMIEKKELSQDEKAAILSSSLAGILFGFLVFVLVFFIYNYFYPLQYAAYFVPLVLCNGLFPYLQNILRGEGKTKKYAVNGVLNTFLIVILNIVFVFLIKMEVRGILLANIIAYVLTSLTIVRDVRLFDFIRRRFVDRRLLREMCSYTVPLVPNLMSWWVISSASKFIILYYLGVDFNGLYAVASRFPVLLTVINTVLLLPMQDLILKESDLSIFNRLFKKFFFAELLLAIGLAFVSPIMTRVLLGEEFKGVWLYMPFLFAGVAFHAISGLVGMSYQRSKNTKKILISTLIGAVISIIVSLLTVERIGLQGISISFFLGYAVVFMVRYLDTFRGRYDWKVFLSVFLSPLICLFIVWFWGQILT